MVPEVGAVCVMVSFCQSLLLTHFLLLQRGSFMCCSSFRGVPALVCVNCRPHFFRGVLALMWVLHGSAPQRYLLLTQSASFQEVFSHALNNVSLHTSPLFSSPKDCHSFLNMSEQRCYVYLSDPGCDWHRAVSWPPSTQTPL